MKIRIVAEVVKNILISSFILYLSFNELKDKIKDKNKIYEDTFKEFDDDDLFKKTDFE